jgi:Ca2+-binding EF-hand superfamily protein
MKNFRTSSVSRGGFGIAAALFGITLFSGSALYAGPPPQDADQGRFPISLAEVDARRAEAFAAADSNGDGLVSPGEFANAEPPGGHHGKPPPIGDRRPDRPQPSAEQIAAMDEALFTALDANDDNVLSRSEFTRQAMTDAQREMRRIRFFAHADADGDGHLSPEEYPPRRLNEFDTNGDGEITRDEIPSHPGGGHHKRTDG